MSSLLSPWSYPILVLAIFTLWASCRLPRAVIWVGLSMACFVFTSLWFRHVDSQTHPLLTFTCDALMAVAIMAGARERHEVALAFLCIVSSFAGLLRVGNAIDAGSYAIVLEILNYLFLIIISGVGCMERIAKPDERATSFVHRCLRVSRHHL
jgi:hypothetical protein